MPQAKLAPSFGPYPADLLHSTQFHQSSAVGALVASLGLIFHSIVYSLWKLKLPALCTADACLCVSMVTKYILTLLTYHFHRVEDALILKSMLKRNSRQMRDKRLCLSFLELPKYFVLRWPSSFCQLLAKEEHKWCTVRGGKWCQQKNRSMLTIIWAVYARKSSSFCHFFY